MEKNIGHLIHKHSGTKGVKPSYASIEMGEIAVNYNSETPRLYIKDTKDGIVEFQPFDGEAANAMNELIINGVNSTILMNCTKSKGYNVSTPSMSDIYGSKESLNQVLSHYKMGLFKDGKLVKECAPCRITKAVDGSDINIDGSEGDIMLFTDTEIYRDRCNMPTEGLGLNASTAATQNIIGLGLMPHAVKGRKAKKMTRFAFTPSYPQVSGNTYYSCYNTNMSGSTSTASDMFTVNFMKDRGGYPEMFQSALTSMQRSRAKGTAYQGIFYEFYEMWFIGMYLEIGSLYFTEVMKSFGVGCTSSTPTAGDWVTGSKAGVRIIGETDGTDAYASLMANTFSIGSAGVNDERPIMGLLGYNYYNFEEALESHRFVDALVKSGKSDKVYDVNAADTTAVVFTYDDSGNVVEAGTDVSIETGAGMVPGKKYYTIRNVDKCQGIRDGVMTYVLNVFAKTTFKENVYHGSVNVGGKDIIFKFSYPTYRGLELFSGEFTQIEGIHNVVGCYNEGTEETPNLVYKNNICYAKDYSDIKFDPKSGLGNDNSNYSVSTSVKDEDIPWLNGFVSGKEYIVNGAGWVKNCDYDVSLYCMNEVGGNSNQYECGYILGNASLGGANTDNNWKPKEGFKNVNASVVGCFANFFCGGRTLFANNAVALESDSFAGGFAIGNIARV